MSEDSRVDDEDSVVQGFFERMEAQEEKARQRYRTVLESSEYEEKLVSAGSEYLRKESFRVGDLVRWKAGMRDRQYPEYGAPAMYLGEGGRAEVPEKGIVDGAVKLGYLDGDMDFVVTYVDGNRLQLYRYEDED